MEPSPALDPAAVIAHLVLEPHPEGGWYRRTWTSETIIDRATGRHAGSAIHYLLEDGHTSAWHRLTDATELWHHHAGAPLALERCAPDGTIERLTLGSDLLAGQRPQLVVPTGWWQRAVAAQGTALCSCTVTPEFEFSSFELAAPGWSPTGPS